MKPRPVAVALMIMFALGLAACGESLKEGPRSKAQVLSSPDIAALQAKAALRPCPKSTAAASVPIGDLVLPCLGGGEPRVRLRNLGRPTVVNLWASWCRPCATELPIFGAVDREVGDRVLFIGVDTADGEAAGLGTLIDAGVHFPNVFDRERIVQKEFGLVGLPATLFLRPNGSVAHTEFGVVDDAAELRGLIGKHLRVTT